MGHSLRDIGTEFEGYWDRVWGILGQSLGDIGTECGGYWDKV